MYLEALMHMDSKGTMMTDVGVDVGDVNVN
jgi:hypothetical protein